MAIQDAGSIHAVPPDERGSAKPRALQTAQTRKTVRDGLPQQPGTSS
jgi:hypothetical protein